MVAGNPSVMYGPRWIWAVPMVVFIPAAAAFRPRFLWLLLVTAVVIIGPVMGFCVPWPSLSGEAADEISIRVLTCNCGGNDLRPDALAGLIAAARPDVVALQEGSVQSLPAESWPEGWHLRTTVASRYPIRRVVKLDRAVLGRDGFATRFDLETRGGVVPFFDVHLATIRGELEAILSLKVRPWKGATELTANIARRARESEAVSRWVGEAPDPLLIAGDFNMPGDSDIFRHSWSAYTDAFAAAGLGFGYTKFTRWHGIRIDQVPAGRGWRIRRCWVGPDVRSDHRPVLADLVWVGGSRPDSSGFRHRLVTARPVFETDRRPDAPSPPPSSPRVGPLSGLP